MAGFVDCYYYYYHHSRRIFASSRLRLMPNQWTMAKKRNDDIIEGLTLMTAISNIVKAEMNCLRQV